MPAPQPDIAQIILQAGQMITNSLIAANQLRQRQAEFDFQRRITEANMALREQNLSLQQDRAAFEAERLEIARAQEERAAEGFPAQQNLLEAQAAIAGTKAQLLQIDLRERQTGQQDPVDIAKKLELRQKMANAADDQAQRALQDPADRRTILASQGVDQRLIDTHAHATHDDVKRSMATLQSELVSLTRDFRQNTDEFRNRQREFTDLQVINQAYSGFVGRMSQEILGPEFPDITEELTRRAGDIIDVRGSGTAANDAPEREIPEAIIQLQVQTMSQSSDGEALFEQLKRFGRTRFPTDPVKQRRAMNTLLRALPEAQQQAIINRANIR